MRKLASVVEIASCDPIPETDKLSVATMVGNGWRVVTGRDEYKQGDLAVYFEIDAALPSEDPRYAFLRERCLRKFVSKSGNLLREVIRIKTVKLRGVVSQGLLMPISQFPEVTDNIINVNGVDLYCATNDEGVAVTGDVIGADVTKVLSVEHYDEIAEALAPQTGCPSIPSDAKMADFPTHLCQKTDELRIQGLAEYFETMKGRKFEVTEKRDGTSVTMIYSPRLDEEPFAVCSRNMRLKRKTDSGVVPQPWKMCDDIGAEKKITEYCMEHGRELAVQGELQGPGINSCRDCLPQYVWQVFKVYDCVAQRYLLPGEARRVCAEIGLEYVPVIEEECPVFDRFQTMDELLKFAEGKTARGNEREGLVFKSVDEPYRTFKAVSNRYLLKLEAKS